MAGRTSTVGMLSNDLKELTVAHEDFVKECRKESIELVKTKDNLLTLENYCERYIPVIILNTVRRILTPMYEYEELVQFCTHADKFHLEMQSSILTDMGEGSIMKNIIMINEDLSTRL